MKITELFATEAPNRFRKVWRASMLNIALTGTGNTADLAIQDVIGQIYRQYRNGGQRTYRFAENGACFCLYWAYDAWCYDIVNAATQITPSSCHTSAKTYDEALDQMCAHVAQYGK